MTARLTKPKAITKTSAVLIHGVMVNLPRSKAMPKCTSSAVLLVIFCNAMQRKTDVVCVNGFSNTMGIKKLGIISVGM